MLRAMFRVVTSLSLRATLLSLGFAGAFAPPVFAQPAAGGGAFTLVVKSDGSLWAFGLNNNGQLGDNSITTRKSPQPIAGLSNIEKVAAGGVHSMAATASGSLYVWGDSLYGQVGDGFTTDRKTPVLLSSLSNVVAIAAGEFHSLALTSSGDVYAWGRNNFGQIGNGGSTSVNVTSPTVVLTGAVAIGAGRNHSLAVKSDGTAWSWGANGSGQLGNNTTSTGATSLPVQMQGITTASKITGGEAHSFIILSDGTVKGAGENGAGQLADGTSTDRWTAITIGALSNVTQVTSGLDHALTLLADGTVFGWGENTGGQLGLGTNTTDQRSVVQVTGLSGISAMAAGWNHSLSVDATGVVSTWGTNASSQLGDGTILPRSVPTPISESGYAWRVATPVFNPASGTFTSDKPVIVTVDTPEAVIYYTQNGAEPTESDQAVASGSSITVTYSQTLKAKAWKPGMPAGEVASATIEMKVATPTVSPTATTYTTPQNVTFSTTTPGAILRYTTDGSDPTESSSEYVGAINVAHTTSFRIAGFKSGWTTSAIRAATYTMNFGTLSVPVIDPPSGTYTGSVTMTTSTTAPGVVHYTTALGTATPATPTATSPTVSPITFKQTTNVRARSFHPDYTASPGEVTRTYTIVAHTPILSTPTGSYAPGAVVTITAGEPDLDTLRMTIDGTEPTTASPTIASGTTILLGNYTLKVKASRANATDSAVASASYALTAPLGPGSLAAGGTHSVLATPDGRVLTWGEGSDGQLGHDATTDRLVPTQLNTIAGVTSVAAGLIHTLAVTADGQLYAWGDNISGRLGDGTTTQHNRPVHISTLSNLTAVAAGDAHSLALTEDGRVFAWGENSSGQLGLGSTVDALVPTEIPTLSNVVAIAAGDTHSLAVTASGQLYAWGANGNSRLGDGTTTMRTSPVLINLSNVVAVAAGTAHSVAMTGGGAVFSWGLGSNGQLGHGTTASATTPTLIPGLHVSAIHAGDTFSAALRSDGVLVAWGLNTSGQLGDSTTTQRTSPTVVSGPASISAFALGDVHALAVTPTGEVWSWGAGASGRLGDGGIANRPTPQAVLTGLADWVPAAPTVSVASGSYASTQNVTITSTTAGAVIRYTLTGADPTEADPEITSGAALTIDYSAFLRVRSFVSGRVPGQIARADYELQSVAPVIDPPTGTYTAAQTVSMAAIGPPSVIRFTTDGSDPTSASTVYSQPFVVSTGQTITARAFPTNGWPASAASTVILTFNYGQLATPTSTPSGGAYPAEQTVALSATAGTTIRFTTNGTDPTPSSPTYSSPIPVTIGTVIIKARAYHPDWTTSDVMTQSYTIDTVAPTIVGRRFPSAFNGWHLTPVTVTFVCTDNTAIASCTSPATINVEGAGQSATGTAVDTAGRQATIIETLNVDLTPPVVTLTSPADGFVTTSDTATITGTASDALSGLATVMCNGIATTPVDGAVSCAVALRPGRNTIAISALDVAGHSASAAVTISRVGTAPSSLTLTPNTRTMIVGEQTPLALRDAFGSPISGATWSSTDAAVVSLSADDPPILTAVAPGSVAVSVEKDGFNASSVITVIGTEGAHGQPRWSFAHPYSPNLVDESPVYANPIDTAGPDMFTVALDTTTGERTVWPVTTATGEAHSRIAAPGTPLLGDTFGGLIAIVDDKALVRFGGPAGTTPWRYESHGELQRPAQGPDGTIYVTEYLARSESSKYDRSVVVLDGATGAVKARVPLANITHRNSSNLGCMNWEHPDYAAGVLGPIVGGDGFGYLVVFQYSRLDEWTCSTPVPFEWYSFDGTTWDYTLKLLRVSPNGSVSEQVLESGQHFDDPQIENDNFTYSLTQLLPDGIGGLLLMSGSNVYPGSRVTRLDAEGNRTDTPLDYGTRIELIGQDGTAYLHRQNAVGTSLEKKAVDVRTWQTKWTLPLEWSWLAARPDGGAMAENLGNQVGTFDGSGQLRSASGSMGLSNPTLLYGNLIGHSSSGGVRAVDMPFEDATHFDATRRLASLPTDPPRWFGSRSNQNAPPTVPKISAKCRPVADEFPISFFYHCYIVVKNQDGSLETIQGGELDAQPIGTLIANTIPGDAVYPNKSTDPVYYISDGNSDAAVINCLKTNTEVFDAMHLDYNALGPNSNRFVVEVMGSCGRNLKLPWRALGATVPFSPPIPQ